MKLVTVPSGPVSVSVTVEPGVAVPANVTGVTPTIGLLGEIAPVSATDPVFTVRLTAIAPRWYDPFFPYSTMLFCVPVGVFDAVFTVKVDCTEPFDGTVTVAGDHDPVIPVSCQFSAPGVITPLNPPMLVNVTVYVVDCPWVMVRLDGLAVVLKSPVDADRARQRYSWHTPFLRGLHDVEQAVEHLAGGGEPICCALQ